DQPHARGARAFPHAPAVDPGRAQAAVVRAGHGWHRSARTADPDGVRHAGCAAAGALVSVGAGAGGWGLEASATLPDFGANATCTVPAGAASAASFWLDHSTSITTCAGTAWIRSSPSCHCAGLPSMVAAPGSPA